MKTALLFPGQGSQYIGMGKEMFARFEISRRTFEEASEVLGTTYHSFALKGACGGNANRICATMYPDGQHRNFSGTDGASGSRPLLLRRPQSW